MAEDLFGLVHSGRKRLEVDNGEGGRVRYKTKGDEWIGIEGKRGFVCDNRGLQMENIKEKPQGSVICSWSNIKAWCSTVSGH